MPRSAAKAESKPVRRTKPAPAPAPPTPEQLARSERRARLLSEVLGISMLLGSLFIAGSLRGGCEGMTSHSA